MTYTRILVVDDEPDLQNLARMILEAKGYTVISAFNGEEALKKVDAEMPDLVLLDVVMPGISGFEVCKAIKSAEKTKRVPVILVTALGRDIDRRMGEESGADGYVTKPFTSELLVREAEAVIEEARRNSFCSALTLEHEQLRGRKILLEYDPVTPYETCIRDFCFEAKGQGETLIVVTPKAGPVTRVLGGDDYIELIPMRDDLVLYPVFEEHSEGPLSFVYDSISDYILSRGFNAAYGYTKNLLERIDEPRITGLFLLNPEAHDFKEVSAIRSLFSNQILFGSVGLEIRRIV